MAWMSLPSAKASLSAFDVGDVGEHAKLDLGIVRGQEDVALLGDEGLSDFAAFLGADRDVLQVGVVGGEAAGRGDGHGVGGVDAAVRLADLVDQGVGVGAGELLQLAPLKHGGGQLVALGGEAFEHLGAGLVAAGLGLLAALKALLVEQHLAELLR